jgi:hypothetical protein
METFIRSYNLKNIDLCDKFIEYHKNNFEYKGDGHTYSGLDKKVKNSIDVTFFNNNKNIFIQEYFKEISNFITDYMNYFGISGYLKTNEAGTNIQYYPAKEGGFFRYHYERGSLQDTNRQVVFMTYLNDIEEGGETEFLFQKIKVKPKKGLTVLWPSDFTHTHRGLPCNFEKWIVTGWFCHHNQQLKND